MSVNLFVFVSMFVCVYVYVIAMIAGTKDIDNSEIRYMKMLINTY